MRVADFIDECSSADEPEAAFQAFHRAATELGYSIAGFIPVTPAAQRTLGLLHITPTLTSNVPDAWVLHYFSHGYEAFDPVLLQTPYEHRPIVWDDMLNRDNLSAKQRRVLAESRDAGMHNGASIPLHGPGGQTYVMSVASDQRSVNGADNLEVIQLMATQFMLAYLRSVDPSESPIRGPQLTERERECLTWTSRGKSAWAIGKILGVSEHTVNFHLKQSIEKLGAGNRMQAVVTAVRQGLILP